MNKEGMTRQTANGDAVANGDPEVEQARLLEAAPEKEEAVQEEEKAQEEQESHSFLCQPASPHSLRESPATPCEHHTNRRSGAPPAQTTASIAENAGACFPQPHSHRAGAPTH